MYRYEVVISAKQSYCTWFSSLLNILNIVRKKPKIGEKGREGKQVRIDHKPLEDEPESLLELLELLHLLLLWTVSFSISMGG